MVSKTLIALALFVALAFGYQTEREYQTAFTEWMQTYRKSYSHDEFQARYQQFKLNTDFVARHALEGHSYTVKMNEFGDLSGAEFGRLYLGTRVTFDPAALVPSEVHVAAPTSMDWRTKGAVTGIKNQGQCGSCWSFSTTGSTEGCHFITQNNLVGLSEQNLMDCSTSQGNMGCNGGLMTQAMDYIISNGGIDTEASYPYTAQDGTCSYNSANSGATLKSYTNVQSGSEADLLTKNTLGPVSVAIDASHSSFQMYSSGVYYEPDCSSTQLDHGVLAVGWGTSSGNDYWIVKNSWGTSWGMEGYIWMSRNKNNNCGIATMATLPQC